MTNFAVVKGIRKYRLTVQDTTRLKDVMSVRYACWQLVSVVVLATVVVFAAGMITYRAIDRSAIVQPNAQRVDRIDAIMAVDSLSRLAQINQAYVDNVLEVLNTNRGATAVHGTYTGLDTTSLTTRPVLTADSLAERSGAEQALINRMEERDRYDVSALARVAADDVRFSPVCAGAVQTAASRGALTARVVIPGGGMVSSTTNGVVLDVYWSAAEHGYVVIVQQPQGFMTRYGGLGNVLVHRGVELSSGEAIAHAPAANGMNRGTITVDMWHNGRPIEPILGL